MREARIVAGIFMWNQESFSILIGVIKKPGNPALESLI